MGDRKGEGYRPIVGDSVGSHLWCMYGSGYDGLDGPGVYGDTYDDADPADPSWVISLSDLMSLLLIFFLVWTTLKVAALESSSSPSSDTRATSTVLGSKEPIAGMLMEFSPVKLDNGKVMVVLDGNITFSSGSARLTRDGMELIGRIARVLRGTDGAYKLQVIGHTDSLPVNPRGDWDSNIELSYARASRVAQALIERGIPPRRILVQGLGDLYPADSNSTPGHMRHNRRVELIIQPVIGAERS